MALTEDRVEYRVIVDEDMINDLSRPFSNWDMAKDYWRVMSANGHEAHIVSRHVITQYGDWK